MITHILEFSLRQRAFVLLGAVALLAGCGHKEIAGHSEAESAHAIGISYSPKNGLLVSPETAKFIGLETVEVSERPIAATKEIVARVFRAATTNQSLALASALVSATEAAMLRPGLTAATLTSFPAEVIRLDHSTEAQTGMMEAILQVTDAQRVLSEGSFVTARFAVGSTNAVTTVPRAALFRTTEGDFAYIVNGEHFIRAAVKLGGTDGEFVEVTDGLLTGDKVVVRPVMTLWMTELHNINGGDACCIVSEPKK